MADQRAVPWPAIFIVMTLVGGYLGLQGSLESSRPRAPVGYQPPALGAETVAARLWQDPLRATREHEHGAAAGDAVSGETDKHSIEFLRKVIEARCKEIPDTRTLDASSHKEALLVLPVMVSGAPYAEDVERRLGSRYAVISALNTAGYRPVDVSHIGFVELTMEGAPLRVPFEEFQLDPLRVELKMQERATEAGDPGPAASVLVLWLTDQFFSDQPIKKVKDLLQSLGLSGGGADRDAVRMPARTCILGPAASGVLEALLTDAVEEPERDERSRPSPRRVPDPRRAGEPRTGERVEGRIDEKDRRKILRQRQARLRDLERMAQSRIQTKAAEQYLRKVRRGQAAKPPSPVPREGSERPDEPGSRLSLFSPRATVPLYWVFSDGSLDWQAGASAAAPEGETHSSWTERENLLLDFARLSLAKRRIRFERTVHSDDTLLAALLTELRRRGVDARSGDHHIVLVSESDTLYGRALPATFAALVRDAQADAPDGNMDWPAWIHAFSYLRGIDGRRPGVDAEPAAEGDPKAGPSEEKRRQKRPEGPAQYDYLRRLATRINRLKAEGKDVKAIGILGSDVYDKLLVMQALRPHFGGVLFFTTDLDARLFHPSELGWTRNLIVASSFGLELRPALQRDVPPFRSTYQTALYATCLAVLSRVDPDPAHLAAPRIFEIGRNGPVDLTPCLTEPRSVHPERADRPVSTLWWLCLMALGLPSLLAGWVYVATASLTTGRATYRRWLGRLWIAAVLLTILYGLLVVVGYESGGGEPRSITDGVSIWPSEALRLSSFFFAGFLVVLGLVMLRRSDEDLAARYHLGGKPDRATGVRAIWADHRNELRASRLLLWGAVGAAYGIAAGLINPALFGEPLKPYRGATSHAVDFVARLLGIGSMLGLASLVGYAAWSCNRFVRRLGDDAVTWPDEARASLAGEVSGGAPGFDGLDRWLTVQLIARRSETIGRMIFYPFVTAFLMVFASHQCFDNWYWPFGTTVASVLPFLAAAGIGLWLRFTARRVRSAAVDKLGGELVGVLSDATRKPDDAALDQKAEALRHVLAEIEKVRRGALAPLSGNPVLVAFLFPFGGMGTVVLLEQLAAVLG
jgi:hypothetical protein